MNQPTIRNGLRMTHSGSDETDTGTLRIDYESWRLALAAIASAIAALMASGALVFALANIGSLPAGILEVPELDPILGRLISQMPWWIPLPLGLAVVAAIVRMVQAFLRLQDSEPAFVISARDLRFKPGAFGESVRIPWTAIRAISARRYRKRRSIVLDVDDLDRYVPRAGLFASLRSRTRIVLRVPLSRAALDELTTLLQTRWNSAQASVPADKAVVQPAARAPVRKQRIGATSG